MTCTDFENEAEDGDDEVVMIRRTDALRGLAHILDQLPEHALLTPRGMAALIALAVPDA